MMRKSSQKRDLYRLCVLLAAGALVSGCSLGNILRGGVKTDYALTNAESDQLTADYLQKIMNERIEEKTKTFDNGEEDPAMRARQESYLEKTVTADLLKALHARGYYAANVDFSGGTKPLSGRFHINYGPQYTISAIHVTPDENGNLLAPITPEAGDILDAEKVLAAQGALQRNMAKDHCYFSLSTTNRVRLDKELHTGAVELVADAGREGHFGKMTFEGNGSVKESYLRRLVPWKEGDCFNREKIENYKTALMQSGLFAQAEVVLPEDGPDDAGNIPTVLRLKERAQRTIGAGLTYYSDEGLGGVLSWEHRNLLGGAEKLKAEINVSSLKQSIGAEFAKPYFLRQDQTLSLDTELRRQDTDAFEEMAIDAGGSISRKFGKHLSGSTGLNASILRINDKTLNTKENYALLSAPQNISFDTRDDTLDPKKGVNLSITGAPFFDLLGQADPFFKLQFTGSGYVSFGKNNSTTLAAKGSIGSIQGADIDSIPATERFYAGGGGSVRGYGYQEVGPQRNGDPTGGLSLATLSLELRTKFTEKIGGVAFVDTGTVGEESAPDFSNMAVGAGIGVRYYTSFGPIRFDIATPLTQKDDTDQSYQFYISIGQAF